MSAVRLKRVYDPVASADGYRVLVDRLWPRGLRKADAHVDLWLKAVAPSPTLRRWFHADQAGRWRDFRERYQQELAANPALSDLRAIVARQPATLVYAAKDPDHNHARVLADVLAQAPTP